MKPGMSLRDAIDAAEHLRHMISAAINEFESETDLVVESVDLMHDERINGDRRTILVRPRIAMPL